MKRMYQFEWDCGRSGSVEGIFIATEAEVQDAIGEYIYFGEILGKHSEVDGVLKETDLEVLDVSQTTIEEMESILGNTLSGYNPLHYVSLSCSECEGTMNKYEYDWFKKGDEYICEYCVSEEQQNTLPKLLK